MPPRIFLVLLLSVACQGPGAAPRPVSKSAAQPVNTKGSNVFPLLSRLLKARPVASAASPGEDDGSSIDMVQAVFKSPLQTWTHIPAPEGAHPVVCDIAWFQGTLWASFGNKTISTDGAQVHSWHPDRGWKLELDWDRGGAPGVTHEQGGQGIARLRVIDNKLYATDADAPNFAGFGLTNAPLEGYVFVADDQGFGPLEEGQLPPKETLLVPLAFHVFDIIKFGGLLVASGGSLSPPGSKSRYPGGLFVDAGEGLLLPTFFPGKDSRAGVVRVTFMHRFRDRLYIGFQNNERRARWDLGVLEGTPPTEAALVLGRVTQSGGWKTRQFASDQSHLYWIASSRRRPFASALFRSRDGVQFDPLPLGEKMGEAQDLLAYDSSILLLADAGLYRRDREEDFRLLISAPRGAPFKRRDGFCTSPLLATPLGLMAGSTDGSGLYWSPLAEQHSGGNGG